MIKNSKAVLFGILISLMLMGPLTQQAFAQTQISVIPPSLTVGEEGVEPPTELFIINITLTDFTDVYLWQMRLNFDPTVLNVTRAWYPEDHIFAGENTAPVNPLIDNTTGYVLFGNSLVGDRPGKTGTYAILCQIEMRGTSVGFSSLTFHIGVGGTFAEDSVGNDILLNANGGNVTVIPEFSSALLAIFFIATIAAAVATKACFNRYLKRYS